ncbi:MAG TPA: hypothetical protein VNA26_08170 [Chitinophagaceae bacterium]|nr:hypothetical protein [Chitinophagaceae bacterium]
MRKFIFLFYLTFFTIYANSQDDTIFSAKPRHSIKIFTLNSNTSDGILMRTNDSSVFVYPGNFREWKQQKTFPIAITPYYNINKIQTKKRGGLIQGILIGAGIGIMPIFLDAIFTPKGGVRSAEGGAYVSIVAVPLGILVGGIVGGSSKKKFQIEGNETKFQRFISKVKK